MPKPKKPKHISETKPYTSTASDHRVTSLSTARAAKLKASQARSDADYLHAVANIFHDNAVHFAKSKSFLVKEARDKLKEALEEEKKALGDLKKKKTALDKACMRRTQADQEYKDAVAEESDWIVREQRMKNM